MLPSRFTVALFIASLILVAPASAEQLLFDFENGFDLAKVEQRDVKASLATADGSTWLEIQTGTKQRWPGITLKPTNGIWNLSKYHQVAIDVKNLGDETVRVSCRIDSPDFEGERVYYQEGIEIAPGAQATLTTMLRRRLPSELKDKLYGMRGYPGGCLPTQGIDPAQIDALLIFVADPKQEHHFRIDNIRAIGVASLDRIPMTADELFPLIDKFGQYIHKDWPGKTHSEAELKAAIAKEKADLQSNPSPNDWNQYGGWTAGPKLEATGHFYPAKHDGKWWLVDPTGRLFWSHGIDCVRASTAYTPITDREHYFAELPDRNSPFGNFYGKGSWAPHGYYQGKRYDTFNFTAANLLRKYGQDWETIHRDLCHQRLRSWGMNTIANWSDENIYLMRKTPYVVSIHTTRKPIEGSEGYWGKFPDPSSPASEPPSTSASPVRKASRPTIPGASATSSTTNSDGARNSPWQPPPWHHLPNSPPSKPSSPTSKPSTPISRTSTRPGKPTTRRGMPL